MTEPTLIPTWLLDVDGVLNAFPGRPFDPDYVHHTSDPGFAIYYRPAVIDRINSLVESGKVNVVWLTTWREEAPLLGRQIGLKGLDNVATETLGAYGYLGWWKSGYAQWFFEQGVPIIWTDDDLAWAIEVGDVPWFSKNDPTTLIIAPNGEVGLTDAHLDEIEAFCAR